MTLGYAFKKAVLFVHLMQFFIFQVKITHISGFQLNFVVNAGHSDLTLAAHGEVVGVGCDERHFWSWGKLCQAQLIADVTTLSRFDIT